jgi:D-alanine-D-alanine ligase-like ATP-grasp enzyme
VTTGVRTHRQLIWATATAGAYRKGLQIENQIAGKNYRLLFLDGELLDVVRRDPPAVVGNGKTSVRDLVAQANRERLDGGFATAQTLLIENQAVLHTLSRQGLTWRSVPALGQEVQVSDIINDNRACENVEAREELCQAIVRTAARAAEVLGVRLAGVDVITTDPTRALEASGGVVLEVNTAPGFHMHYYRRGEPCRVAEHVLVQLLGNVTELDNQRGGARVRAF